MTSNSSAVLMKLETVSFNCCIMTWTPQTLLSSTVTTATFNPMAFKWKLIGVSQYLQNYKTVNIDAYE